MGNIFTKSRDLTREFLNNHEEFTFLELRDYIIHNGGILRVAPNYTIKEYLKDFEEKDKLDYSPRKNLWRVLGDSKF